VTTPSTTQRPATQHLRRLIGAGLLTCIAAPVAWMGAPQPAHAQSRELNLYSARHYQSDNELYAAFTQQTGIKVNQIQAQDEAILERLKSEGKASPADIIFLVDAARLHKAQSEGLFQPVKSITLEGALPSHMRASDLWFGFTTRARILVIDATKINPKLVQTYDDLARPELKGKVCTRSGAHPYMLSLVASIAAHQGEAKAQAWANGVVANLARTPRGGDTDQIKGVMSGECAVAVTNSYYLVRLLKSKNADERNATAKLTVVWPNQKTTGTHVNVSGAGVARYAPNADNAKRFLEFLASPEAQTHLANANNEWPASENVTISNPELTRLGKFKADKLSIGKIADLQPIAARIIDKSGWK